MSKSAFKLHSLFSEKVLFRVFFNLFLIIGSFLTVGMPAQAQQPFVTDNAEVTDKGKFHLELGTELDKLQTSSLPISNQNGIHVMLAYGLVKDVEVNVNASFLTLIGDHTVSPRFVNGIGDTTVAVKYNFYHERKDSRLPALAISGFVQFPTGNARRSLGSGITDYGFYAVAQKTYKEKNIVRVNAGYLFGGNTVNGVEGISAVKGKVFTGGTSYVRKITEKLQLGGEITGAVTGNFQLSKGQLQAQFGGNYQIKKNVSIDFGVITGRFAASPRIGGQIGTSIDF